MSGLAVAIVGLHIASHHVPDLGLNDVNPGAYVVLKNGVTFGAYRNSMRHPSVYAGMTLEHGPFGLTLGVMRESKPGCDYMGRPYLQPGARWIPMVAPSWRPVEWARITYVPRVHGVTSAHVLHLSVEWRR